MAKKRRCGGVVRFVHVKSHTSSVDNHSLGNHCADRLCTMAHDLQGSPAPSDLYRYAPRSFFVSNGVALVNGSGFDVCKTHHEQTQLNKWLGSTSQKPLADTWVLRYCRDVFCTVQLRGTFKEAGRPKADVLVRTVSDRLRFCILLLTGTFPLPSRAAWIKRRFCGHPRSEVDLLHVLQCPTAAGSAASLLKSVEGSLSGEEKHRDVCQQLRDVVTHLCTSQRPCQQFDLRLSWFEHSVGAELLLRSFLLYMMNAWFAYCKQNC